jgi:hypothetical protein
MSGAGTRPSGRQGNQEQHPQEEIFMANRIPYDNLEMIFAFHISEKARARREQHILQFPPDLREEERRRYTLEHAVKEVLGEVAEVSLLIRELES